MAALMGCGDPCPQVPLRLQQAPISLPWTAPDRPLTDIGVGDRTLPLLFDTGFPRTSLRASDAGGLDLGSLVLSIGEVRAGPLSAGLLLDSGLPGVLGSDVLHQLPLVFDARAQRTLVLAAFEPPRSAPAIAFADSGLCGLDEGRLSPLFVVRGEVEGSPVDFVLDSGSEATLVRREIFGGLAARPRLEGVLVASGFAGTFSAEATRARRIAVGEAEVVNAPVLSSPEADSELDRLSSISPIRREGLAKEQPPLGGFLGRSFLREFRVSLSEGRGALSERRLGLERFDSQDHFRRDFVGIGVITSESADPPGLRVAAFLSVSPAREAGVKLGDTISTVDGTPAQLAPYPLASPGSRVILGLRRGQQELQLSVEVRDLLPDP